MTPSPLVSLIMPSFGMEEYLAESVESVLTQTYANLELIVAVERGPSDAELADAALGPVIVVGRGGLSVEITRGRICDPEVQRMCQEAGAASAAPGEEALRPPGAPFFPIVLSARREARAVAEAW